MPNNHIFTPLQNIAQILIQSGILIWIRRVYSAVLCDNVFSQIEVDEIGSPRAPTALLQIYETAVFMPSYLQETIRGYSY
jgi:hypothetical protein